MSDNEVCNLAYGGKCAELKARIMSDKKLASSLDGSQRLPLHWAVLSGNKEVVQFLLDVAGNLDAKDDFGWTPLLLASSAGHIEIVRLLLSLFANPNAKTGSGITSLHYSASKSHLENDADVNARDSSGSTPLHRAASKGNTAVVQLLLDCRKCDVNLTDSAGNTPLHLACEEGRVEEAKLLVKHGAFLDKLNKEEKSPLDMCDPGLRKTLSRLAETG